MAEATPEVKTGEVGLVGYLDELIEKKSAEYYIAREKRLSVLESPKVEGRWKTIGDQTGPVREAGFFKEPDPEVPDTSRDSEEILNLVLVRDLVDGRIDEGKSQKLKGSAVLAARELNDGWGLVLRNSPDPEANKKNGFDVAATELNRFLIDNAYINAPAEQPTSLST